MSVPCADYFNTFDVDLVRIMAIQPGYQAATQRALPALCTLANCSFPCPQTTCNTLNYDFVTPIYIPSGYTLHSNYAGNASFQCWGRFFWAYRGEEVPRVAMGWLTSYATSISSLIVDGPAYGASELMN